MRVMGTTKAVLAVGLNVGKEEPFFQELYTRMMVRAKMPTARVLGMVEGEWGGVKERTIHFEVPEESMNQSILFWLAGELKQDAVAVLWEGCEVWDLYTKEGTLCVGEGVDVFPVFKREKKEND